MKSRWFKVLWRFWPGLLCLTATFLLLAWSMEPRPRSVVSFPFTGPRSNLDHALSPDGNYLATRALGLGNESGNYSAVTLHELSTQREVFSESNYIDDFRFDSDGSLTYLITKRRYDDNKEEQKQLARWRPGEQKGSVVWEHDDIGSRAGDRIIKFLGTIVRTFFQLSPDGRTLAFTTFDQTLLRGEFIDCVTGVPRQTYTINCINNEGMLLHEINTIFASDSKTFFVQTVEIEPNQGVQQRYWHWVDVQSGKVLQSIMLPNAQFSEIVFATTKTPVAKEGDFYSPYLLFVNNHEVQTTRFDELKRPSISDSDHTKLRELFFVTGPEQTLFVYMYEWLISRKTSKKEGYSQSYYWATRELSQGTLIQSSCLYSGDDSQEQDQPEAWFNMKVLQGRFALFEVVINHNQGILQQCLLKVRTWLGIQEGKNELVQVLDVTTGARLQKFHLPQSRSSSAFLSPDGKTLTILSSYDKKIQAYSFDFPFHQPWLLIWSWALGVALSITILVELRTWWRRRKA